MRLVKNILYASVLSLLVMNITGCKFGPNFTKPEPIVNAHYLNDSLQTDTTLNIAWWEMFGDTLLDTLIKTALDSNKDILITAARIEEYRSIVGYKKGDTWPAFGYQGNGTYGTYSGFIAPDPGGNVFGGLAMNWEIDFWGKFRRATEGAKADLLANEFNRRTVQISLISDITVSYFTLLDYKWRKNISENTVLLRKENVDIIRQKFDVGLVPEIDLNNAELQYAIALASTPQFERFIAMEETKMSILLGMNPRGILTGDSLQNQVLPEQIPAGLPSSLLLRRPDIAYSEAKYHAQMTQIGVAQAQRFPAIGLTGLFGAGTSALTGVAGGFAWNAGASLVGPIFQWGKTKEELKLKKQELSKPN